MLFGPSVSGVADAKYCSVRSSGESQSSIDMASPSALYQAISVAEGVTSPETPNRDGRSAGFSRRSLSSFCETRHRSHCHSSRSHCSQLSSSSMQYALLLPFWLRPNSSPALIIGIPADSSSVPSRFRMALRREVTMSGRAVGPSTPWLKEWLSSVPSRLFSPLARLCFWLYVVRSARVKPSCAVTKFTLARGPRCCEKTWAEPASRLAMLPMPSDAIPCLRAFATSVSQKSRIRLR